eukprot:jgi/Botrbrau1/23539/Bobra.0141s0010.1
MLAERAGAHTQSSVQQVWISVEAPDLGVQMQLCGVNSDERGRGRCWSTNAELCSTHLNKCERSRFWSSNANLCSTFFNKYGAKRFGSTNAELCACYPDKSRSVYPDPDDPDKFRSTDLEGSMILDKCGELSGWYRQSSLMRGQFHEHPNNQVRTLQHVQTESCCCNQTTNCRATNCRGRAHLNAIVLLQL